MKATTSGFSAISYESRAEKWRTGIHKSYFQPNVRLKELAYVRAYMLLMGYALRKLDQSHAVKGQLLNTKPKLSFDQSFKQEVGGHSLIAKKAPVEVLKRYEKWKDIVMVSGPSGLRKIKGFHDESLRGEWKAHRSSRLGLGFRVIYRIKAQQVRVEVVDLTAHDYRRKK